MRKSSFIAIFQVFLFVALFNTPLAQAGKIYFEPGIGGGMGSLGSTDTTTPSFHLKMGSLTDYIYILADAKFSYVTPQDTYAQTWLNSAGLALAFDWNIPIRLTLGLDLINNTTISTTGSNPTTSKFSGMGSRIGLGYYFSPSLLLNLETQSVTFSAGGESSGNYSTWTVSLSFPMEISYPEESWRIRQGTKLR